ncbi:MAG: hypothetical protein CTY18_03045 [Methylomonas sp.]|nr:MAG: hypothetical protein CTY18_03045 [Methylomonas sp.]
MIKLGLPAIAMLAVTGCASIVSSNKNTVAVQSNPAGADFVVANDKGQPVALGTTPLTVTLLSSTSYFDSADYTVDFKKPGYKDGTVKIESGINSWYWGNVVFGALIGFLIVDPATGAMYELPASVSGNLVKAGGENE